MNTKWIVVLLALIIGFVGGMLVTKHDEGAEKHAAMATEKGHGHHAAVYEVPAGVTVPTVGITVHEDPKSGYNVEIATTHFRFAPENASTEAVAGEGHAHIYVDGKKINRVYGTWYHLANLGGVGEHEVRVELSANNHSAYAQNGEIIDATVTVNVMPEVSFDASAAVEHSVTVTERSLVPKVVTVTEGDNVRLVVATDEAGEFHIAGYEIEKEVDVDGSTAIEFVADKAGRYNLELHPGMAMEKHGDTMHMEDGHAMESEDIEIGALVVNPK